MRAHYYKAILLMSLLFTGNILAQHFSHPADPVGDLQEYSIYTTDGINFGGSAGTNKQSLTLKYGKDATNETTKQEYFDRYGDYYEFTGLRFPEEGYVGTNGTFDMTNIYYNADSISFFTNTFVGTKLILSKDCKTISKKTIMAPAGAIVNNKSANKIAGIDSITTYVPPVASSADWLSKWSADKIEIPSDAPSITTAQTVDPGKYKSIKAVSNMIFTAGTYEIESFELYGHLKIVKEPQEYCRIFIKNSFLFNDQTPKSIQTYNPDPSDPTKLIPGDLGKVLIYCTAETIESNRSFDPLFAPFIDATIIAPAAHITFHNYPVIRGQLFAKEITFQGDFDASKGQFVPWISANVTIGSDDLHEDSVFNETTMDMNRIDGSRNETIHIELAQALDIEKATISYELLFAGGDNATADDFVNPVVSGKLTFLKDETTPETPLTVRVKDDNIYERNQTVTLRLFYGDGDASDKIVLPKNDDGVFEQTQVIHVIDDDPQYHVPDSIVAVGTLEVYENQKIGEVVGQLSVKDKDLKGHKLSIIGGDGASLFEMSDSTIVTSAVLDYETATEYTIIVKASDVNNFDDDSIEKSLVITVLPTNDIKADAKPDSVTVTKGNSVTVSVETLISNDTDADLPGGDQNNLLIKEVLNGSHGSVSIDNGVVTYTNDGENGVVRDTFKYVLADSVAYNYPSSKGVLINQKSDTGYVYVIVGESYDKKPTTTNGTLSVAEFNGSIDSIALIGTLVDDYDLAGGDELTLTYSSALYGTLSPATGTVLTGADFLKYTYTSADPVEQFIETITLTFTDRAGNSVTGEVTVLIDTLNDNIPELTRDTITVPYGVITEIPVITNYWTDLDVPVIEAVLDSTIGTVKGIVLEPSHGFVTYESISSLGFIPDINDNGIDTTANYQDFLVYQILDSVEYDNDTAHRVFDTLFIRFDESSREKPVASPDKLTCLEGDSSEQGYSVMANDRPGTNSDGNPGADLDYVYLATQPSHGTVTLDSLTGEVRYVHDHSESFEDRFTYRLVDKAGKESPEGVVTVTISPLNDNEPHADTLRETVLEGDSVTFFINGGLIDSSDARATHYPDINTVWEFALIGANGGALYADSVKYDSDTKQVTYYHNGEDDALFDTVQIEVRDSTDYDSDNIHSVIRTVVIAIEHLNDNAPEVENDTITVLENGTGTIDLAGLVTDLDGGAFTFAIRSNGSVGTASLAGSVVTYDQAGTGVEQFEDSFTFVVHDEEDSQGNTNSAEATIVVVIVPQNDELGEGVADRYTTRQEDVLLISAEMGVLANDDDFDRHPDYGTAPFGNSLSVELVDPAIRGEIELNSDGAFSYSYTGTDSIFADQFTYILIDSTLYHEDSVHRSAPITVDIVVTPTPATPLTILTAAYLDTNEYADGFIDLISFSVAEDVSDLFIKQLTADQFMLNSERNFAIDSVVATDNGFAIVVTEQSERPNTAITSADRVVCNSFVYAGFALENATITPVDSVAPVILYGEFRRTTDKDSLAVYYSEPVLVENVSPYEFLDQSTGFPYFMELTYRSEPLGAQQGHQVASVSIAYPVEGDSVAIVKSNMVCDAQGNYADLTVWAPLLVPTPYDFGLELYVYPQPLVFEKQGETMVKAQELDPALREFYRLEEHNVTERDGVAIILESKGPLRMSDENVATLQILDNTGNAVVETVPMTFVEKEDSDIAGIFVWNGKNRRERTSGRSAYMVIVNASVVTDEGENSRTITKEFIRTIGVKQ